VNDMTLTHAAGCHMPEPMTDLGGFLCCPACKWVQPKPKASTQPTNYVCRVHNAEPVSWKGTGCPRCAADAKKRKAPKRDDEMELWPW